ncbi:carbohydrate kinase [Flavobacterium sp. LAR06]|uniref:carbohydrate kinase family protein n=1 Tax=Flavobacterium sp. LAR06 TaxID=3064897 RepID=UPI0035BF3416
MTNSNTIKVTCFGELLWDYLPGEEKKAGGASFNVAYNLFKMGIDSHIISAVGNDALGDEIISKIKKWGIYTENIQVSNKYPTGTVIATFDQNKEAHYDLTSDVAWDYIEAKPNDKQLVRESSALVFGSLASRNRKSRNSLFELLEDSSFNVFDINLRKPHYDFNLLKELLHKADIAKFNKAELLMVLDFLCKPYTSEEDAVKQVQDIFKLREIIISKGSKGALYVNDGNFHLYPALNITIADTIGSGDSFLAGFLSKRFVRGATVKDIMQQATALGAFITSKVGACPEYTPLEFQQFKNHKTS